MPTIAIKQLTPHPAQMRTSYDLEALAALTLQIYERGLNTWQPILAASNGADAGINGQTAGSLHIISGHRRQMAQLLAFALKEWAEAHPETDITVEVARTMLDTLVDSLGSLEKVIASLLVKHGEREVAYVSFEGNRKAEVLALQNANFGGETPDMLGIAHSFGQAIAAGATEAEIARNVGQSIHYVHNHLALTRISPELAGRSANRPYSSSTAQRKPVLKLKVSESAP